MTGHRRQEVLDSVEKACWEEQEDFEESVQLSRAPHILNTVLVKIVQGATGPPLNREPEAEKPEPRLHPTVADPKYLRSLLEKRRKLKLKIAMTNGMKKQSGLILHMFCAHKPLRETRSE